MGRSENAALDMKHATRHIADDAPYRKVVDSAAKGDRQAFDRLRREHEDELRVFLRRRAGPDEVDDLLQDVWLAAWTSIKTYSGKCRFKTWLYSIAIFKVKDLYRRRLRDQVWRGAPPLSEAEGSVDPLGLETDRHWVRDALESLTADQRQLLELYYYAQLNLPEIATVLNRPLSAIKYQFYRAHRDVADVMDGTGAMPTQDRAASRGRR